MAGHIYGMFGWNWTNVSVLGSQVFEKLKWRAELLPGLSLMLFLIIALPGAFWLKL